MVWRCIYTTIYQQNTNIEKICVYASERKASLENFRILF